MKKVFDRIWEWIKSTAWFQVVILVGIVVGIVLSIQPITTAIKAGIDDADRTKYFENNRLNFDSLVEKINKLDEGGEEFAVIFASGLPSDDDTEKAVYKYEDEVSNPVKVYYFQTDITNDNKSSYNNDENWYEYFKVEPEMTRDIVRAANYNNSSTRKNVYEYWKRYTADETTYSTEVEQTTDFTSDSIPGNTIIWFRASKNIDPEISTYSTITTPAYSKLGDEYNFHMAKIYLTLTDPESTATESYVKIFSGLKKFFGTSIVSTNL